MYDAVAEINKDKTIEFILNLQQDDGSFTGDKWGNHFLGFVFKASCLIKKLFSFLGEVDTRFSFCAVAALSLLVYF